MKKDSVLGTPFYRFYYDKSKVDDVLQNLKRLKFRANGEDYPNNTNWIWDGVSEDGMGSNLHEMNCFSDIFGWIQECLDEVAYDMGMQNRLKVNAAWANLNKPGDYFFDHIHSNTFVSSNYYASGHSRDHTIWTMKNLYFHSTNIYPCGPDTSKYYLVHKEPTEPGKYIVFPSTIMHRTEPNTYHDDRITIACDAFPTGLISQGYTSRLKVQVL